MDKKIDGRQLAKEILNHLKKKIKKLKKEKKTPCLAIFSAGDNPASESYIRQKRKAAKTIGAKLKHFQFKKETSYQEFAEKLNEVVKNPHFSGVIIQKPLPVNLSHTSLDSIITIDKDIEGANQKSPFISPVSMAVLLSLDFIRTEGKKKSILRLVDFPSEDLVDWLSHHSILLIGRGRTGGQPIAKTLSFKRIKFLITHRETENLAQFSKKAQIIISCVGEKILKKEMLKDNVILIGVGIRRVKKGLFRGDFNEKEIKNIVSSYTPTPGGIGPLTVAFLMANLITACEREKK
ncbi:bifunctional 5,10-methylenetetrahydrofolate dehydrogenase/5,10-methenyltetrahydrofolate cyclohydrolase [Candidatus Microgenomates bacterium]|nr:bifunctional 5,10-methylenetetrahydrofolate dehydrogenase/5,10-methenyltetrahydrofolate cyclohydrolase [Candidatus Microgenomates bacterium]